MLNLKNPIFCTGICALLLAGSIVSAAEIPFTVPAAGKTPNPLSVNRGNLKEMKPVTTDFDTDIEKTYKRELQKLYADQDKRFAEAKKLAAQGKFSEALKIAENVLSELKLQSESVKGDLIRARVREVEGVVAQMHLAQGREKLREAEKAVIEHRFSDAVSLAIEAVACSKALAKEAEALQQRCREIQRSEKFDAATSVSEAAPKLEENRRKIKTLLTEAKIFLKNKRYSLAIDRVEQIYLLEPFNLEAVYIAEQAYQGYYTTGYHRHRADFELVNAFSAWHWAEPVFSVRPPEPQEMVTGVIEDNGLRETNDKLNRIIFPRFDCKDASIDAVIKMIKDNAARFDTSTQSKGVNIQNSSTPEDLAKLGKVNLSLTNIPLGEVLRYVSLMTGLKYRVERDGIRLGTAIDTLYDRDFTLRPHLLNQIAASEESGASTASSSGSQGNGGSGVFKKLSSSTEGTKMEKGSTLSGEALKESETKEVIVTPKMCQSYLEKHGITFGPGSSIVFLAGSNKLTVKNTMENLSAIDSLIRQMNALETPLVLVELKCLEISDTDMEELGFHWSLGDNNLRSNMNNSGVLNSGAKSGWMFGPGVNATNRSGTKTVVDGETIISGGSDKSMMPIRNSSNSSTLINNLNIFPMLFGNSYPFGSDVPLNISLTVNALSQNERTELISAPKVMALSGQTGMANLTKTYYFPDDWSELEIEETTSENDASYRITQPIPTFEEQLLGMQFTVIPTVESLDIINLNLNVTNLGRNGNDSFNFTLTGMDHDEPVNNTYTVWKPIITDRTITTSIDVKEGQTVVVGGSTDNKTTNRTDKLPFFCELPLIGRLFQSQAEAAERKNMLLFVTARLVDNTGAPINKNRNIGIPEFNR